MEKIKNEKIVIDLFAGCGGMSNGFIKAGYKCLAAVEIDKEIALTYSKNHPNTKIYNEDIKKINQSKALKQYKNVDVVMGGPPCQGFSMAGRRIRNNGAFLNDSRNHLFKEFYETVNQIRPKVFIIENVLGIISFNHGSVKNSIFSLFEDIGYETDVKVLKASEYGIPQYRKRAFFIGNNLELNTEDFFPKKTHGLGTNKKEVTIQDAIFDLPFIENGQGSFESEYDKAPTTLFQKERRKKSTKLFNHVSTKHDKKNHKYNETYKRRLWA